MAQAGVARTVQDHVIRKTWASDMVLSVVHYSSRAFILAVLFLLIVIHGCTNASSAYRKPIRVEKPFEIGSSLNASTSTNRILGTFEGQLLERMSGCENIFLDLGSNSAVHVRQIWEAENYPLSYYLPVFDR